MAYAIDLSPRQSTRTLEQAVRHQAEVFLQPRARTDDELVRCRLIGSETPSDWRVRRACLVLELVFEGGQAAPDTSAETRGNNAGESHAEKISGLVGTYCDIDLPLGEHRYLFCSDVVAAAGPPETGGRTVLYIARPETIQVMQRRRFWRFRPAHSARVDLSWVNGDQTTGEGIGWLCNVSADGLACRVDGQVSDQIGIGEQLRAEFALTPGDPQRYTLDAVLCNKTPAGTQGTTIIGLQFLIEQGHETSAGEAEALRQQLLLRYTPMVNSPKGGEA